MVGLLFAVAAASLSCTSSDAVEPPAHPTGTSSSTGLSAPAPHLNTTGPMLRSKEAILDPNAHQEEAA